MPKEKFIKRGSSWDIRSIHDNRSEKGGWKNLFPNVHPSNALSLFDN